MKGYHDLISQATGITDEAELQEIEELMRLQTGGVLDHLDRQEFREIARIAVAARAILVAEEA